MPKNQHVSGNNVIQTKGDGNQVTKDYNAVLNGYNGLYNNPQQPQQKDYAQAQAHQLGQQYHAQHQGSNSAQGKR
ncbi:hypothetical protein MVLG_05353 [Microbotryum lychnidis-dioicae p1A1 Lamole]|uniref:Uncharacterized protein n=2 Tax=Microbotryum TaxID=34416 RepID=U5HDZ9_USTV1|nr:hypothetical protein MVLG_05353 [Microbotryum lychnidis-dioicae p1A1 Lamole]SGY19989.1 BQ5605_C017g08421 [Microbotryum silenes-dioicae]|eukprot:KDE04190.1 hypothetical protein MVLG_05353 [Microbotryum lychnidis-dioicae p1A1 Lamole]